MIQLKTFLIPSALLILLATLRRKVMYTFLDAYHGLYLDKKEFLMAQLDAYKRLSKLREDNADFKVIDMEIAELKMAVDLIS